MPKLILEIACFSYDGVLQAIKGGANRIELCENPADGGTTPSYGMLKKIKAIATIPVFPIIRPRVGNFVYDDEEIEIMKADIGLCKDVGFEGVVFGILDEYGKLHKKANEQLIEHAYPMQTTLHRAFDRSRDMNQTLEDAIQVGFKRILTSGQYPSVYDGMHHVKQLIHQANNRIIIMPGSGLNSQNIHEIASVTKASEFHTAARKKVLNENVYSQPSMSESLSFISVDESEVRRLRNLLDTIELF